MQVVGYPLHPIAVYSIEYTPGSSTDPGTGYKGLINSRFGDIYHIDSASSCIMRNIHY
ncbi:MAG: hypothetical protein R2771_04400 [Saprospiraceae bacterium]